jgi:hypothetical protein
MNLEVIVGAYEMVRPARSVKSALRKFYIDLFLFFLPIADDCLTDDSWARRQITLYRRRRAHSYLLENGERDVENSLEGQH